LRGGQATRYDQHMKCHRCKQTLSGPYLQAGQHAFHRACFTCAHCHKPLDQSYASEGGKFFHPGCHARHFKRLCAHCRQPLDTQWVTLDKKLLHPACYEAHYQLRCAICTQKISGSYQEDAEGTYHPACFAAAKLPPCDLCGQPLQGKYLKDIWGHQSHIHHGNQPTLTCHICGRLIGAKTSNNGIQHGDGRVICGFCQMTEVATSSDIEQARQRVLSQLQAAGFTDIPSYVNVSLADQKRLNRRLGASPTANSHGYTQTLERQVAGVGKVQEHTIYLLFGLPRLVFEGVLAHEFLHVWLNSHGFTRLPERDVEGFCNLATALIYQQDNSPLAQVLLQRMQQDSDPVYGEGYRRMATRLQQLGWEGVRQALPGIQDAPINRLNRWVDRWI
jgi:hypothetical protein